VITGPGSAATTCTSTPKSLSFFSISRLVISSDSGVTDSWAAGAASSRWTWGSLVSASSTNSGGCCSLASRLAALGTSSTGGSMTIGGCSGGAWPGSGSTCSRSRSSCSPMRRSSARSTRAWRRLRQPSMAAPRASARRSHEKRSASALPTTSIAIHSTPEPAKPSQVIDQGPSVTPSTPPAWPGSAVSHWYRRDHSSAALATISSTRPTATLPRGGGAPPVSPRRWRASADSQARAATGSSHQAEKPNRK
jgi:hypothetical protein